MKKEWREQQVEDFTTQLTKEWDAIKADDPKNYGLRYEYGCYLLLPLYETITYGDFNIYMRFWYNKAGCTFIAPFSVHMWSKGKQILPKKWIQQ